MTFFGLVDYRYCSSSALRPLLQTVYTRNPNGGSVSESPAVSRGVDSHQLIARRRSFRDERKIPRGNASARFSPSFPMSSSSSHCHVNGPLCFRRTDNKLTKWKPKKKKVERYVNYTSRFSVAGVERPGVLSHRLVASNLIRAVSLIGRISFRLVHKKKRELRRPVSSLVDRQFLFCFFSRWYCGLTGIDSISDILVIIVFVFLVCLVRRCFHNVAQSIWFFPFGRERERERPAVSSWRFSHRHSPRNCRPFLASARGRQPPRPSLLPRHDKSGPPVV